MHLFNLFEDDATEGKILHPDRINLYLNLRKPNAKPIVVGRNIPYKAMDAVIQKIVDKYSNVEADMFEFRPARSLREDSVDDKNHHSELINSLENWMAMEYNFQDIETILLSPESRPFTRPPAGVQWVYRAIVPRSRRLNSIKARGPVVAYATKIEGAIEFVRGLDTIDPWLIVRKPFNPADMLLDFTAMYETIVQPDAHSRYAVEHEVWMKSTPAYNKATKQEVVLTSAQYYADNYAESINEDSGENDLYAAYDKILIDLCDGIVKHQKQDSDLYGLVAAAVVDPEHNVVYGINHKLASGKRVHAERAAMANYIKKHGAIPENSVIITTLSPCTDEMPDRKGPSCTELLNGSPITRVYAGYRDPSQTHLSHDDFDVVYTEDKGIESVCKDIADCFLDEGAYTDPANYRGESLEEEIEKVAGGYKHSGLGYRGQSPVYPLPRWNTFSGYNRNPHGSMLDILHYLNFLLDNYKTADIDISGDEIANTMCKMHGTNPRQELKQFNNEFGTKRKFSNWSELKDALKKIKRAEYVRQLSGGVGESITEAKKRKAKTLIDGMIKTLERQGRSRDEAIADIKKQVDTQFYESIDHLVEDAFNGIDINIEIQKDDEYVDDDDYDNQVMYVTATSNGRELGHVLFAFDGDELLPQDLEVDERYRGQGIAKTMYDYVKSRGYKIRRSGQQTDAGAGFWDKHKPGKNVWEQSVAENFADGKHPGRKGLAKRMGVNTKASVSSLRKTAKHSTGEKARMAHWMANMKAGKKKHAKEAVDEDAINEIENLQSYQYTGGKDVLKHPRYTDPNAVSQKNIKPLPGGSGLNYATIDNGRLLEIRILDQSGQEAIGQLKLLRVSFPIDNAYQVSTVTVDEDYRGKGIAKSLYGVALSILKITLLAGSQQTPGGKRNWMSLAQIPGVEVRGYVELENSDLKYKKLHKQKNAKDLASAERRNTIVDKNIDIVMGRLGGDYLGDDEDGNMIFAFDVVPGTGSLTPVVKTELNKLYYSEYDMLYVAGLYAQWRGA